MLTFFVAVIALILFIDFWHKHKQNEIGNVIKDFTQGSVIVVLIAIAYPYVKSYLSSQGSFKDNMIGFSLIGGSILLGILVLTLKERFSDYIRKSRERKLGSG